MYRLRVDCVPPFELKRSWVLINFVRWNLKIRRVYFIEDQLKFKCEEVKSHTKFYIHKRIYINVKTSDIFKEII